MMRIYGRVFISAIIATSGKEPTEELNQNLNDFSDEHISELIFIHTGLTLEEYLEKLEHSFNSTRVATDSVDKQEAVDHGFAF